jgi:Uma2 family endonuclease
MVALKNSPTEQPLRKTAREYLEHERTAETKSEFHGGIIVAMAGASPEHNTIVSNVHGELYGQLRSTDCRLFINDLRVRVQACDKYYYPDLVVACEEPRYEIVDGMQSLLNPTLIVKVLSDSTEQKDRGEKWTCYQTVASLQNYVLVSQTRALIEVYRRQKNGWLHSAAVGVENVASLETIGCELRLADVYARVPLQPFPPQSAQPAAEEQTL